MNPAGGICTGDIDGGWARRLLRHQPVRRRPVVPEPWRFSIRGRDGRGGDSDRFLGDGGVDGRREQRWIPGPFICCYRQPNKLFINDGKGHFTERAAAMKLDYIGGSMTMAWADTDNDGDLDSYLATTGTPPPPGHPVPGEHGQAGERREGGAGGGAGGPGVLAAPHFAERPGHPGRRRATRPSVPE